MERKRVGKEKEREKKRASVRSEDLETRQFWMNKKTSEEKYLTLTFCTAPKGPNSCQRTFSSVSGAKL